MARESTGRTKWEEIRNNLKLLAVVISTLLGFLFLVLSVLGVMLWITSGDFNFLGAAVFSFALFIPCGYIVKRFEREWTEFERRRGYTQPTTTDTIKAILKALGYIVGSYLLFVFLDQYVGVFPKVIQTTIAIEIVRTIVQIDGVLIGFCGLVFAQLFWAIHSQQNVVYEETLTFKRTNPENPDEPLKDKTFREELFDRLKELEASRRSLTMNMLFAVVPLLLSILLALSKMGWSQSYPEGYPTRLLLWDPIMWMWLGIGFFILFIIRSKWLK